MIRLADQMMVRSIRTDRTAVTPANALTIAAHGSIWTRRAHGRSIATLWFQAMGMKSSALRH